MKKNSTNTSSTSGGCLFRGWLNKTRAEGSSFYQPMPPNCLGQMLTARVFAIWSISRFVINTIQIFLEVPIARSYVSWCGQRPVQWHHILNLKKEQNPIWAWTNKSVQCRERERLSLTKDTVGKPIPKDGVLTRGMKAWIVLLFPVFIAAETKHSKFLIDFNPLTTWNGDRIKPDGLTTPEISKAK